ncbi:hypothetical protein V6N13_085426 [Hibiscus sabdariffa]
MAAFAFVVLVFPGSCLARQLNQDCGSVFCGSLNISYPLRLKNQPPQCGYHRLELECEQNNRTTLVGRRGNFSVEEIFYENQTMRVVDAGLNIHDCNSLPLSSPYYYIGCRYPQSAFIISYDYYHLHDEETSTSDFDQSCTVEAEVPISVYTISTMSTLDIYKKLSEGTFLTWDYCEDCCSNIKLSFQLVWSALRYFFRIYMESFVYYPFHGHDKDDVSRRTDILCLGVTGGVIVVRYLLGMLCLLVLVIYKWRRRHLSVDDKIEEFLRNHNLSPIRYSFKEIKKMTTNFKEKLGEGGYGSVFKGKLRSRHHVAVKLLGKSKDDSIVSLTAARGTIGYIAPELVYKNLGGISYKADVYSFGMLLMEMVGRRKNVNAFAAHTSQIYFPSWIYDRLDQGDDMELGDVSEDEKAMVRKMIITAFWCIQLQPADRPSMSKVLRMLESDVKLLEMPPKPFYQLPLETSSEVHGCESSNDEPSASMSAVTTTSSNVV